MPEIIFSSLCFCYPNKPVFNDFSYTFSSPGIYLITGPSGCGKTTLLRLIAGLEKPTGGTVAVSDPCAFAFQEYRLFPHMTVLRNVTCVRRPKTKEEASENDRLAMELLSSLGLSGKEYESAPDALSGGMKQRVSLARALFSPHPIKLLDEVTKELDQHSIALALHLIARYSENSLILFSTHHPEDCDHIPTTLLELPSPH